jgi:lysophospholipase L1-like esterase
LDEPDIIVVESCAYNHWSDSQSDLDNYWLTLAHIADAIRASGKKVLFLATIAPNSAVYAKSSAAGASWSEEGRWDQARLVRLYLDTFIRFAKNQNIPLVDVYHESLDTRGEGDLLNINKSDYIHPSVAGFRLIADLLARGIGNLLY